jgi:hypothetical protein
VKSGFAVGVFWQSANFEFCVDGEIAAAFAVGVVGIIAGDVIEFVSAKEDVPKIGVEFLFLVGSGFFVLGVAGGIFWGVMVVSGGCFGG